MPVSALPTVAADFEHVASAHAALQRASSAAVRDVNTAQAGAARQKVEMAQASAAAADSKLRADQAKAGKTDILA